MENSNPPSQEVVDNQLIEKTLKFKQILAGEGAATCQVCGSALHGGESVVAYVFRPAGEVVFQVGHVVCGNEEHELPKVSTFGVRELLVEGRVGVCPEGAIQSSWPVLPDPEILAVSAAATKSVQKIPESDRFANVEAGGESRETSESSVRMSLGEARRRAGHPDRDDVRGLFWGDVQR